MSSANRRNPQEHVEYPRVPRQNSQRRKHSGAEEGTTLLLRHMLRSRVAWGREDLLITEPSYGEWDRLLKKPRSGLWASPLPHALQGVGHHPPNL